MMRVYWVCLCLCEGLTIIKAAVRQGRTEVSRDPQQILRKRARKSESFWRRYESNYAEDEQSTSAP